jgi:gamma-glutamyl phosphate reductase
VTHFPAPILNTNLLSVVNMSVSVVDIARRARLASTQLQSVTSETKSVALRQIQAALLRHKDQIIEANKRDLEVIYQGENRY